MIDATTNGERSAQGHRHHEKADRERRSRMETDMKSRRTRAVAAGATLALCLLPVACSSDDSNGVSDGVEEDIRSAATDVADAAGDAAQDVVEVAARNFANAQGKQAFDAAGHSISGDLTCTANATDGLTAVEISCTGTTDDDGDAVLTGVTSEFPGASFNELEGAFVGTVDGETVFDTDRLGG
jgi:hypothetical protein